MFKKYFFAIIYVFIFRCMNALALSVTPSISSNEPFLIKGLLWRREGSLKSEWKQTGGGEESNLSLCSLYQNVNTFIVVIIDIYLCKKHCHLLCWVYKKIILFSLFTPQFFIQKFISILHVKWTGMNMGKAGWKLEDLREHTFWMNPKSFFCN